MSRTVRIVAIIAAVVLVAVAVITQLGGDDPAPDTATPGGILPGNPAPVTPDSEPEPTVDPQEAEPGPTELQEPGTNHDHDHEHGHEGRDEVISGLREATAQESAAMTAVSAYMRMDTTETREHRHTRLERWFTHDASQPNDPLPAEMQSAVEGILDSRLTDVRTIDDGTESGEAVVEIGLLRNMVLTLDPAEPPITSGGNMLFTVWLRQVDGQWLVSDLRYTST